MEFPKLSISNFLTIDKAELELSGRGLLLIQGVNEDDTSAASNGAGKSSIVDALCWCLYGVTARDVSGDAVVNRAAKKDCDVSTVILDGGTEYTISRYRKHKTHKNAVLVAQKQLSTGVVTDLSKGTDRETQDVINKIMGCSIDVFLGAIYAGQEKMPDLPGMTDKFLKLLVEEAAGTEELAEAHKEAARRALTIEKERDVAATHLKSLKQRADDALLEHKEAVEQHKLFEDTRKDRARLKMAPAATAKSVIAVIEAEMATLRDKSVIQDEIDGFDCMIAGRKAEEVKLRALQVEERDLATTETRFRATVEQLKQAHERAKNNLAAVGAQVGKPCGECGKAYEEHDLDELRTHRTNSLARAADDLREYVTNGRAVITKRKAKIDEIAAFEATMTDVSASLAAIKGLRDELAQITQLEADIAAQNRAVADATNAARAELTGTNPWAAALAGREKAVAKVKTEIDESMTKLTELEKSLDLHKAAVEVYGPAGVRAHILDTVTPYLNARTGEYLGALADGNIHANWSTLAKNAKGELKEKFNIEVTHDEGGDSFAALSGGEKRKVRLATNLALQDLKASRGEKPIDLWIGDEIDHALDEPGLERLMGVLDRKARERGTVLVISHQSLDDWIDNVITVTKSGKKSTVDGATHRGL